MKRFSLCFTLVLFIGLAISSPPLSAEIAGFSTGTNLDEYVVEWKGGFPRDKIGIGDAIWLNDDNHRVRNPVPDDPARRSRMRAADWSNMRVAADTLYVEGCALIDLSGAPSRALARWAVPTSKKCEILDRRSRLNVAASLSPGDVPGLVNIDQGTVQMMMIEESSEARQARRGGNLRLVLRRLVCAPGARLYVDLSPGPGPTTARTGNMYYFIEDESEAEGCLRIVGAEPNQILFSTSSDIPTDRDGGAKVVKWPSRPEIGVPSQRRTASYQTVFNLHKVRADVADARAADDPVRLAELFQKFRVLAAQPVESTYRTKKQELTSELNDLWDQLIKPFALTEKSIPLGDERNEAVMLAYDMRALQSYVLPTIAAVVPSQHAEASQYLGVIENTGDARRVRLRFEASFEVDPFLLQRVREAQEGDGLELKGVFNAWNVAGLELGLSDPGLLGATLTAKPDGSGFYGDLILDEAISNVLVLSLSSPAGVPLKINWSSAMDPSRELRELTIPFTFARRTAVPLALDERGLTNAGFKPVTVESLGHAAGVERLSPELGLMPGETRNVPSLSGDGPAHIVPLGVRFDAFQAPDLQRLFEIVDQVSVLEYVRIQNLMGNDEELGAIDYVSVTVTRLEQDGTRTSKGPFRLASRSAEGSEQLVTFFGVGEASVEYLLEGSAYFEDGSRVTLEPIRSNTRAFKITRSDFPSLPNQGES